MHVASTGDAFRVALIGIVAVLGATRATQIVLHDRILRGPRDWLLRRLNPHDLPPGHDDLGYAAFLLTCPWCVSVWIGIGIAAGLAWDYSRPAVVWTLVALALSLGAVVVDRLIDRWASDEDAARRVYVAPPVVVAEEVPAAVEAALAESEEP